MRRSNIDGAAGAHEEVERIVAQIRRSWPRTHILLRADSGFCREELMTWCEANKVDYLLGLAKNKRLIAEIEHELAEARASGHFPSDEAAAKLLKISARVTVSVRRVKIAMASAYPWRDERELAHLALRTAPAR